MSHGWHDLRIYSHGGFACGPFDSKESVLCVPKTSSMSCDQVILVDQATDASAFSDAVVVEIGSLG